MTPFLLLGTFAVHTTSQKPKAAKEPNSPTHHDKIKDWGTILLHPDSFKINPAPNSVGLINCLPQP
jgi:hypothetical protein